MKKIYWAIQQTEHLAGTELVTINIINRLINYRDITLIVTGKKTNNDLKLDKRVKVVYLNVPYKYTNLSEYLSNLANRHRYFHMIVSFFKGVFYMFFKKYKYRKMILDMTTKDDLLIFSSYDNYLFAPFFRRVYFHFHFNAKYFRNLGITLGRIWHRKPNKYIFLTETTKSVIEKKTIYKNNEYVYNPIRFERKENYEWHNNEILFLARYANQKNPLLAVKVARELKNLNVCFHLSMYGNGHMYSRLIEYVDKWDLHDVVKVHKETKDVLTILNNTDLLLITSRYEGLPLSIIEANSQSVPVISSNWGDAVYEIVNDGENGFVVKTKKPLDYALKIKEVLESKERLLELKKKTYANSERFSDKNIVDKWLKILEEEDKIQ